jgi:hypothetical protein
MNYQEMQDNDEMPSLNGYSDGGDDISSVEGDGEGIGFADGGDEHREIIYVENEQDSVELIEFTENFAYLDDEEMDITFSIEMYLTGNVEMDLADNREMILD